MSNRFIGLFCQEELCGVVVLQQLQLRNLSSFGERDSRFKTRIRELVFRNFASNVLVVGNNMLTGQNAFALSKNITTQTAIKLILEAVRKIKTESISIRKPIHLTVFKDFSKVEIANFSDSDLRDHTLFTTQPNMVFNVKEHWISVQDYIDDLTKKYRDQYKRARKKAAGIEKRKLDLLDISKFQKEIHRLYMTVANQAPFNTFYLEQDHFLRMKELLAEKFLFYGYFLDDELIGFSTLIKNGGDIDTYFLGYDDDHQRERMLYLNMLYDMVSYAMKKGFRRVVLARTALEIKSSVGATDVNMYGYIRHSNPLINRFMPQLFKYFEPEIDWHRRHPFKEQQSSGAVSTL